MICPLNVFVGKRTWVEWDQPSFFSCLHLDVAFSGNLAVYSIHQNHGADEPCQAPWIWESHRVRLVTGQDLSWKQPISTDSPNTVPRQALRNLRNGYGNPKAIRLPKHPKAAENDRAIDWKRDRKRLKTWRICIALVGSVPPGSSELDLKADSHRYRVAGRGARPRAPAMEGCQWRKSQGACWALLSFVTSPCKVPIF